MSVQVLANESHFADHLLPVFRQLPAEARGTFTNNPADLDPKTPAVVASWGSYKQALKVLDRSTPVIFFEHGAGFTYETEKPHPSYAGGPGRERVNLFLNVNRFAHDKNAAAYPNTPGHIIGSPKLDGLATIQKQPAQDARAVVAYSWHWECKVAPETRTAFPHYKHKLGTVNALHRHEWKPLGHAHPRAWRWVEPSYRRWRWDTARHFEDVVAAADVYVCDTSSTIYEMAALGRPVILLNAPWYRRHVSHGLRFWDHLPGPMVDNADQLAAAVSSALNADTWAPAREEITRLVYPHLGTSAKLAAGHILDLYG